MITVAYLIDEFIPCDDMFLELDHESGSIVPMRRDFGREVAPVQDGLDDSGRVGSTIQAARRLPCAGI